MLRDMNDFVPIKRGKVPIRKLSYQLGTQFRARQGADEAEFVFSFFFFGH
jgi:hypothetical protein